MPKIQIIAFIIIKKLILYFGLDNNIYLYLQTEKMVVVAQLVRALVCGTGGRGFESRHPPLILKRLSEKKVFFFGI